MEEVSGHVFILVVADSNFINLCKDPVEYVERLKKVITGRSNNRATLMTVSGKYGLSRVDETLSIVEVEDKNKTVFGQYLENATAVFDELLVITIAESDPYIAVAKEVVTNASKTITQYGYNRKE